MFPLAVKSSMNSLELVPSSQRIKPKSEILRVREFGHDPKLGARSANVVGRRCSHRAALTLTWRWSSSRMLDVFRLRWSNGGFKLWRKFMPIEAS